jgi:hypothetical protein
MDQKSIVLYLGLKQMNATEIHNDLVATLKDKAMPYSTVTYHLRSTSFTPSELPEPEQPAEPDLTPSDEAILLALAEQPFASVRQLARATHLSLGTVYWRLTHKLGFTVRHLRWVPHTLSAIDKQKREFSSGVLRGLLEVQRSRSWHDIVTLDEAWFYFKTDYETIWLPPGVAPPQRERHTIASKKMMITIVWNPSGFHVIRALPKGAKFNADYYMSEILTPLLQWRSRQVGATDRKLIVHADNARPHTAKKVDQFFRDHGLLRAAHPPYSPDLAPCDFYLFGYIKGKLQGQCFDDGEQLLRAIDAICQAIEKVTLENAFRNWEERLSVCAGTKGEFINEG